MPGRRPPDTPRRNRITIDAGSFSGLAGGIRGKGLRMRGDAPAWAGLASRGRRPAALGSTLGLALCLSGCAGVLDPQGPIGLQQRTILLNATAVMLAIVVPVILATLAFAWWFRSRNARARYRPDWSYSGRIEFMVWSIPALVILFLGGMTWVATHDLDPARPLAAPRKPSRSRSSRSIGSGCSSTPSRASRR